MTLRQAKWAMAIALALTCLSVRPASADEPIAIVDGTVTVEGKPLAAGRIFFHLDDDQFFGAKIKEGRYKASRAPVGTWKVTVEGEAVPKRYASEETSPLTVQIKEGTNTFDIDFK